MKKLNFLFILLVITTLGFFSGCSKDDDTTLDPLTITVSSGSSPEVAVGLPIAMTVRAASGEDLDEVRATKTIGTTVTPITDQGFPKTSGFNPNTEYSVNYTYTVETNDPIIFTFTAKDKKGATATTTYTVNPSLGSLTGQRIYNNFGPNLSGYDFRAAISVSASSASADIVSSESTGNVTPFVGRFDGKNGTTFVNSSSSLFDVATQNNLKAAFIAGTPIVTVSLPVVNDVFIAKITRGSTESYAIFKITSKFDDGAGTGGTVKNNDYIEFSVKK
ncbi:MAG: hypothetical protein M3Q56_06665 [Bacteroidota bacterium]|nr:hypothetical protein [Bacteroidota bacterium]